MGALYGPPQEQPLRRPFGDAFGREEATGAVSGQLKRPHQHRDTTVGRWRRGEERVLGLGRSSRLGESVPPGAALDLGVGQGERSGAHSPGRYLS
jgi:hypothetical protein